MKNLTETQERILKIVRSNILFAKILRAILPVDDPFPMKLGKNGMIPALAKDDEGLRCLLNHPKEEVRLLVKARQAVKSWPLHINRVNSLMNQAKMRNGKIGAPLSFHSANTGRWGGTEGINLQNLGGRGRGGSGTHSLIQQTRTMLQTPDGYVFGIVDYAQIEARVLAWLAGQDDLVKGFTNGEDIYSEFASTLFGSPVRKKRDSDPKPVAKMLTIRRGFGKDAILGCIALGSHVYTDLGWTPIEKITHLHKLWDGEKWVDHRGIIKRGKKTCLNINGVWLTPEHEILHLGVWTTAAELNTNNPQLVVNMENLQLWASKKDQQEELSPSNVVAPVVEYLLRKEIIWSPENLFAVMCVLKRHPGKLRAIRHLFQHHTNNDCLIEFVRSLVDVKQQTIRVMVDEVLESGPIGSQIESLFLNTWQRYRDGMIQNLKSTELTIIGDMNLVISDSQPGSKILETADILYSGNYKRFQVGGLLCSNCGYGMGTNKFFERCRANSDLRPMIDSGRYDWGFINRLIKTYRKKYSKIPMFWQSVEKAWRFVTKYPNEKTAVGLLNFCNQDDATFIVLPSGRFLRYPNARIRRDNRLVYRWGELWGGSITENIVQAVARDVVGEALLRLEKEGFDIILHIHDEIICLFFQHRAEDEALQLQQMIDVMSIVPFWASDLPIAVEGELTERYKK